MRLLQSIWSSCFFPPIHFFSFCLLIGRLVELCSTEVWSLGLGCWWLPSYILIILKWKCYAALLILLDDFVPVMSHEVQNKKKCIDRSELNRCIVQRHVAWNLKINFTDVYTANDVVCCYPVNELPRKRDVIIQYFSKGPVCQIWLCWWFSYLYLYFIIYINKCIVYSHSTIKVIYIYMYIDR